MTDALIVIDMQQGSFGPATPRHDAAGLVGRLNLLTDDVRAGGGAVVWNEGLAEKRSANWASAGCSARQPWAG